MEAIEKIAYRGHIINIYNDDFDQDTPNEYSDGITLVHFHRSFTVEKPELISEDELSDWYNGEKIEQAKTHYIFPVSAYIHSGVVLSLHDTFVGDSAGWDTSHVGAVLVDKKEAKSRKQAYKFAEETLKTWNSLLSGEVYGFIIDEDGESCWGFVGDMEESGLVDEAKSQVDYMVERNIKKHADKVKTYIKKHVPLASRESLKV